MPSADEDTMNFSPGQRVLVGTGDDPAVATVMYVGPVEGTKPGSVWVGVDYDDPARGKHDGTHQGKRYFQASGGQSGAFVKAAKERKGFPAGKQCQVRSGVTLMEAVRDKYGLLESASGDRAELDDIQRSINAPSLEMVGFEKVNRRQADLAKLRVLGLLQSRVRGLGNERDIGDLIPRTTDLDLNDNLLDDWEEIAAIAAQLPRLRYLNVGGNKMRLPRDLASHNAALSNINHLIVSKLGLDWEALQLLVKDLRALTVLQAWGNRISEVGDLPDGMLENLEQLDLNSNPLKTWAQFQKFSKLRKLWIVNLNECQLQSVDPPTAPASEEEPHFPALKILQLGWNGLNSWTDVANLRHLSALEEVRIRNNPILETENGETCRQIFIASIPTLKAFNGSELFRTERYGAEVDYVKRYGKKYLEILKLEEGSEERRLEWAAFTDRHPFYEAFVRRYGAPEESELREVKTDIKSSLLLVTIECPAKGDAFQPVQKKLPPTMTVQKVRPLVTRVVKAPRGTEIAMSVRSCRDPDIEVPMDNPLRDLHFYCIEDGDAIVVKW